jgi:hypothetical protein
MKGNIYILFLLFFLTYCSGPAAKLNPEDYIRWYERHKDDLIVIKSVNSINYTLQYNPKELLFARNYVKPENKLSYDSLSSSFSNTKQQYFIFKIGLNGTNSDILNYNLKSNSEYNQRVDYYAFYFPQDIILVQGTDTLRCIDSHFERTYGLTPYITLNLVFPESDATANMGKQIIYDDVIFNNGKIKLSIPEEIIKKIPILSNR